MWHELSTPGGLQHFSHPRLWSMQLSHLSGLLDAYTHSAATLEYRGALRCLVAVDGVVLADHSGLSPFSVSVASAERERGPQKRWRSENHSKRYRYFWTEVTPCKASLCDGPCGQSI